MPSPNTARWKNIAQSYQCAWVHWMEKILIYAVLSILTEYYNYKHTYSIVLLALVDANYKFIAFDVGAYGKKRWWQIPYWESH